MTHSKKDDSPRITKKEIAIIKRAQAGDEHAFTQIFNKYKSFVDNILCGYIKDRDEARDITNMVFLKVYDKLSKFSTFDSFGGWLRRLTNRVAIDYLRIKGNHRYTLGENDSFIPDSSIEDPEHESVNHMMIEHIFEILDRYPPHVRKIFELHYMENMQVEVVASKLHIPVGTVKSILSRTRDKIRNQFNKTN